MQEGASAQMLQVEQKSSPSAAEFALEGQDTHGQDCSPEVCRCTLVEHVEMMISSYRVEMMISFSN